MKKRARGNDVSFEWTILRNGSAEDFSNKVLDCYIKHESGAKFSIDNMAINGNVVSGIFRGKHQRMFGNHALVLVENGGMNDMYTIDNIEFVELVRHTQDEGGGDATGITTDSITMTTDITLPSNGIGIKSIVQTTTSEESEGVNIITITLDNGSASTFRIKNGAKGEDGDTPTITAEKSGTTTTLYVDGTAVATIKDGLTTKVKVNGTTYEQEDGLIDLGEIGGGTGKVKDVQVNGTSVLDEDGVANVDISGKADKTDLAPEYSTTSTYAVGEIVYHDGLLYECNVEITIGETWNADHWKTLSGISSVTKEIALKSEVIDQQITEANELLETGVYASGEEVSVTDKIEEEIAACETATAKASSLQDSATTALNEYKAIATNLIVSGELDADAVAAQISANTANITAINEDEVASYDIMNYGLFVTEITEGKCYDDNGVLQADSEYNTTNLIPLDKSHDILIKNMFYCYAAYFDASKTFLSRVSGYQAQIISKDDFPTSAKYIAFSYNVSGLSYYNLSTFCTFTKKYSYDTGAFYSKTLKKKNTRPRIDIYTTDTEAEILSKLADAVFTRDCDVYWETGTYDFSQVFADMWTTYHFIGDDNNNKELPIGGNCCYYFNGSTINATLQSGASYDVCIFSSLCDGTSSFEMHDGTLIADGGVEYCVHSEGLGVDGYYTHKLVNMTLKQIGGVRPLGCGTGRYCSIVVENCTFDNTSNVGNANHYDIDCHGINDSSYTNDAHTELYVKDSYLSYGVHVALQATNETDRLVYCNNSSTLEPKIENWDSLLWNNVIRS